MYTFDKSFELSFQNWDKWETRGTIEDIRELEEAERMVIAEEAMIESKMNAKLARAQRIIDTMKHIQRERIKYRSYQRAADSYKKTLRRKVIPTNKKA